MYKPEYQISPKILDSISKVEAAKAVIENSPLLPLYERQFKAEATVRKVHFSTAIEGNYLELNEVRQIVDGSLTLRELESGEKVVARQRDIQEVINYRDVVKYIEKIYETLQKDNKNLNLSEKIIKEIHELLIKEILPDVGGKYRSGTAVTINYATGEKLYPYEDVENFEVKLRELIDWYNDQSPIHPILKAGLLHLEFVRIHPFEEGNGRMARALATLSLSVDGYDVGHFFCLDEYYDSAAHEYYEFLGKGFKDPTIWLEYFSLGMAIEFNRIKDRVMKISKDAKVKSKVGQMFITERQEMIIEWLNNYGYFRNQDFETLFPGISDDTVLREIKPLLEAKIITKKGITKSARYELG